MRRSYSKFNELLIYVSECNLKTKRKPIDSLFVLNMSFG